MSMVVLPKIVLSIGMDTIAAPAASGAEGTEVLLSYLSGFGQLMICPIVALGGVNLVKQVTKEVFGA